MTAGASSSAHFSSGLEVLRPSIPVDRPGDPSLAVATSACSRGAISLSAHTHAQTSGPPALGSLIRQLEKAQLSLQTKATYSPWLIAD